MNPHNIRIDATYVAQTLAHADVLKAFVPVKKTDLYEVVDGIEVYLPVCQDYYNQRVDYYFEVLTNSIRRFGYKSAIQAVKSELEVGEETMEFIEKFAIPYSHIGNRVIYEVNDCFFYAKLREDEEEVNLTDEKVAAGNKVASALLKDAQENFLNINYKEDE